MAESVSNLSNLLKEVWTQDRLERQFYEGTRFLDKIEKTTKYNIGRKAEIPVEASLPGGASSVPASGAAPGTTTGLNSADNLHVNRAEYDITHHWQQIALEAAVLNQADSVGMRSTVDAMDQTVVSNLLALRKDINRQVVSNGDALIAGTLSGAADTTVLLDPAKYGADAIRKGWIRANQQVDIGTTANETSVANGDTVTVASVTESDTAPAFVASASVTETASTFVSLRNARSGTTSFESNGLRTLFGSTTTQPGNINPATAGNEFWKPALVDTSTTIVSLDLLLSLQRAVYQKAGNWPTYVTTSVKQASNLYALAQPQVRYQTDKATPMGAVEGFELNGLNINMDPDIPDQELYLLTLDDLCVVAGGAYGKPTWASDIEGSGGRTRWVQGGTQFADAVYYAYNLAIKRRNRGASAISLTA